MPSALISYDPPFDWVGSVARRPPAQSGSGVPVLFAWIEFATDQGCHRSRADRCPGRPVTSGSRRPHDIDAWSASGATNDIVSDRLLAPIDHPGCPARHVWRHHDIRQFVERIPRGQDGGMIGGGIVVPGVDNGAGDA